MKFEYRLATAQQTCALFDRFFPAPRFPQLAERLTNPGVTEQRDRPISELAAEFGKSISASTFSPAELQGYLLSHRTDPVAAVRGARVWEAREMKLKEEKEEITKRRREKQETARVANQSDANLRGGLGGRIRAYNPRSATSVAEPATVQISS